MAITEKKYWQRATLDQLAADLDEIDTVPVGIIGALKRLLDEVERLDESVTDLWGERR